MIGKPNVDKIGKKNFNLPNLYGIEPSWLPRKKYKINLKKN